MTSLKDLTLIYSLKPTPTIILDVDGPVFTILHANAAFLSATNSKLNSIVGRGFFEAFPKNEDDEGENTKQMLDSLWHSIKYKKAHQIKKHLYKIASTDTNELKDRFWKLDTYPILDDNGEVAFIIQSAEDITNYKEAEDKLVLAQKRDFDLFNFSPVPMWAYDVRTYNILAANKAAQKDYGYTLEEFLNLKISILWPIEDFPLRMEQIRENLEKKISNKGLMRHIKKDGTIIEIEFESSPLSSWGEHTRIVIALDVTSYKRLNALDILEKEVLELNSNPTNSLTKVLNYYLVGIESLFPDMNCSIMKVKDDQLYTWASASLARSYLDTIEGAQIGENSGSCGTAAYLKKKIIASDINNDLRWLNYRSSAIAAGLNACWSLPIINIDGNVIATFAVYYKQIREPNEQELKIIERASSLLKVILESRQYADALQSSNELYDYVNKATNDAIYDWNIVSNELTWGEALSRVFGYSTLDKEFTKEMWIDMLHPDDIQRVTESLTQILDHPTDLNWVIDYRFKKANGNYTYVEENGYILRNKDGRAIRMIGVLRNVTERVEQELEIKTHLERYNSVSKATSDTIWDCNLFTEEVIWNNGIKEVFGYKKVSNTYEWWCDHVHPNDLPNVVAVVDKCKEEKQTRWSVEYRFMCANGSYKFVLDRGFMMFDEAGVAIRMIGAMQDITERINYIQTIESNNIKIRDMAWAQSHLVRAPLARILGIVQLLSDVEDGQNIDKQLLAYLDGAANELDDVVKSIVVKSLLKNN